MASFPSSAAARPLTYPPFAKDFPHMLHGADYNPDQWQHMPEVLEEDMRMAKLAGVNSFSIGIFAWTALEPEEGRFTFEWLDRTMDVLAAAGMKAVLATPSGARPAWMAQKYPEVLRVDGERRRHLFGRRHNHCMTSPVYRQKCRRINTLLAERYASHPALMVWHISNEYGGHCHCPLCEQAFREWLQARYGTLEALNHAWWSAFWSHTITDWSQIESPSPIGEMGVHGLNLDWHRFTTHQTVDFMKNEIAPLREITPGVPVTTNMMGFFYDLDYWKFMPELDIASWDAYPEWGGPGGDMHHASYTAMIHDLNRSLKGGRPWMLMESTPSMVNWRGVNKLKRPGMHRLASLQAVAHGAETVQYFQWRKSRGSSEKFHGAVVDHVGHENTRVFRDVAEVGRDLARLDDVVGTSSQVEAALVMDWECRWAVDDAQGIRTPKGYAEDCHAHYKALWRNGIAADVISADGDFSPYRLVIAPMLYMVRPGVAERLDTFVREGGTLVLTYWSGVVDASDLCFLGGFPGPLRKLAGVWAEEIDALYEGETNPVEPVPGNALGLTGTYAARHLCEVVHLEGATALATYGGDFYAGRPALTVNRFGKGSVYYIAARLEDAFLVDLVQSVAREMDLRRPLPGHSAPLPEGVSLKTRTNGVDEFLFAMNFSASPQSIDLGATPHEDVLAGEGDGAVSGPLTGVVELPPLGVKVLRRKYVRA
ncbi:beta-galactosidase [Verrucomicrobia bacterium LW23]|nr:beta-galactosidase [Verrucomicrobia bacterium LW23]